MDKNFSLHHRRFILRFITVLMVCLILTPSFAEERKLRGWNEEEGYQYVQFGWYPYETDGVDQPILWRILSVSGETAYVQSAEVIDAFKGTRYTTSTQALKIFRKFLFTQAERDALLSSTVLSLSDLRNPDYGFSTDSFNCEERSLPGTPYALSKGVAEEIPNVCYWVGSGRESYYVNPDGAILPVTRAMTLGAVPVLRVDFSVLILDGGTGTQDDPFTSSLSERCMALESTWLDLNLDGDEHALPNPARKAIPVYSGPGREYFSLEGSFITKHKVSVLPLAYDGDWLMIEYTAGSIYDLYPIDSGSHQFTYKKVGYISLSDFPSESWLRRREREGLQELSAAREKGSIAENCFVYDSLTMTGDPIYSLSEGTFIWFLGYEVIREEPVAYIEVEAYNTLMRGFVSLDAVELEDYDMEMLRRIF